MVRTIGVRPYIEPKVETMNTVVIASSESDAAAAAAIEEHHGALMGMLAIRVESLVGAASRRDAEAAATATADLVAWCEKELVPHALAEEAALYPAAHSMTEGRLLVNSLLAEHQVLTRLVRELSSSADPVRAAATATALRVLFDSHQATENEAIVPLLVADPGVSLAGLLEDMHGGMTEQGDSSEPGCAGHQCSCGESDESGYPELDARAVPHAIRHATIFGALDSVPAGGGMVLLAPHDPLPLLAQLEQRAPGEYEVSYVERGPETWRLRFDRVPADRRVAPAVG